MACEAAKMAKSLQRVTYKFNPIYGQWRSTSKLTPLTMGIHRMHSRVWNLHLKSVFL
jgi:hypothetical protein